MGPDGVYDMDMRPSAGRLFQLCLNHKALNVWVIFHPQNVRAATNLTVFHVRLAFSRRRVHRGFVPFAAARALKSRKHPKILKLPPRYPQCENPNSTRTPQTAAAPKPSAKTTPISLPEAVLLLQPWSTATSHMTNSKMAAVPSTLVHMKFVPPESSLPAPGITEKCSNHMVL